MNTATESRRQRRPAISHPTVADSNGATPAWLALVADKVKSLRFGIVQITVHEARVVQIERIERTRFEVGSGISSR